MSDRKKAKSQVFPDNILISRYDMERPFAFLWRVLDCFQICIRPGSVEIYLVARGLCPFYTVVAPFLNTLLWGATSIKQAGNFHSLSANTPYDTGVSIAFFGCLEKTGLKGLALLLAAPKPRAFPHNYRTDWERPQASRQRDR